ncbi:MAG: hypothetical protein IPK66_02570 [Rhodospirillales bacterium]|nr:hypothetical protein [Rhodospirillales bacterium]
MNGLNAAKPSCEEIVFDRRSLLLALVPAAVYVLLYWVLNVTRATSIGFAILDAQAFGDVAAAEAHYRYLWVSAFLLSCAVSLAVAVNCAFSLWASTPPRERRFIFTVLAAIAVLFIAIESVPGIPGQERWYAEMGEGLYRSIFGRLPARPDGDALLRLLDVGLDLTKAFGAVALVLITTALIVTLAQNASATTPERRAEQFARALARQRTYLQQGTAVYVFALIAMLSWMYWPMPFFADEATRVAYRQLIVGTAVLHGVTYSLGIAAIYLPPAVLLYCRIASLAGEAAGPREGASDWLRDNGLAMQPLDQLRQIAAMLLPAFVSVLPAISDLWK